MSINSLLGSLETICEDWSCCTLGAVVTGVIDTLDGTEREDGNVDEDDDEDDTDGVSDVVAVVVAGVLVVTADSVDVGTLEGVADDLWVDVVLVSLEVLVLGVS